MKNSICSLLGVLAISVIIVFSGCEKKTDQPVPSVPEKQAAAVETPAVSEVNKPAMPEAPAAPAVSGDAAKLVAIPLKLPEAMFVGTPQNLEGVANLEKPLGRERPPFLAPEGVINLALNKPVTSSESSPFMGELSMIVDDDKAAADGSVVELGPLQQWVAIDLQKESDIYAIVVWHFHKTPVVYYDIVVQVAKDEKFIDAVTVFNNDQDNTLGLGAGTDKNYIETAEGKLIDCKAVRGRYVRLWSKSNNQNDYNHYIEVAVYGK